MRLFDAPAPETVSVAANNEFFIVSVSVVSFRYSGSEFLTIFITFSLLNPKRISWRHMVKRITYSV